MVFRNLVVAVAFLWSYKVLYCEGFRPMRMMKVGSPVSSLAVNRNHIHRVAAVEEDVQTENVEGDSPCYILSTTERARTVAASCASGTLCTTDKDTSMPFGSHVDYVLDANGWPVFLLSDQSVHTQNINDNPKVSLFAQMPYDKRHGETSAAMSRVTISGTIVPVEDKDELFTLRTDYTVTHAYSMRLVESPKFFFMKLQPDRIYYVGGYGVNSAFVSVDEYQTASPDILALEARDLVTKINNEQKEDLRLVCNQFIGITDIDDIVVTTIDRLGMTVRVTHANGERTDEFRCGFVVKVFSLEDAKSEIVKIFQEAWEKDQGDEWEDMGPPVTKTTSDILD